MFLPYDSLPRHCYALLLQGLHKVYLILKPGRSDVKMCVKTSNNLLAKICFVRYHHHHHHLVVPLARRSLALSRHFSLSLIASGRSSGLHPVSSHSYCMYVRAGRPAFARSYVGVHRSTSLMSSSLLLQQCPACLVRLTWIVFVMWGRWPYSWCLVGCCRQDCSILLATFLSNCCLASSPAV